MKSLKDFVASRVSGSDGDWLLAGHPNNPAILTGDKPYFSDSPPRSQFLYDAGNGSFYLIACQVKDGRIVYVYDWGHPSDSYAFTLDQAERELWLNIRGELPPSISETEFTKEQVMAIYDRWTMRGNTEGHLSFVDFIATAKQTFGMDKAVTIPWCGMHLAIETDGYTHS